MLSLIRFLKAWPKRMSSAWALKRVLAKPFVAERLPSHASSWPQSLQDPTGYYLNCVRYFYQGPDTLLRQHRGYFKTHGRGFGEDAFHVMWDGLCRVLLPSSFLEIGVYRGQVISLVALLTRNLGHPCRVCGVSPFSSLGDSVSRYSTSVDYFADTVKNFHAFGLESPRLIRGKSGEPGVVQEFSSRPWDLIYIDGNHDEEAVAEDFTNCAKVLRPGGKIVLDDSARFTAYRPPPFATSGHPGPSRFASGLRERGFLEILCVGHNRVFEKSS